MKFTPYEMTIKPTIKTEWFKLHPRTNGAFWWRVAMLVRKRRVRHRDTEKIRAICVEVDSFFPRKADER